uniref:Uncharacterized protein n=1 Tax=Anguilla anguilla TaxID=7936 RepID=A0A0E9WGI7_ANGAN
MTTPTRQPHKETEKFGTQMLSLFKVERNKIVVKECYEL